MTAPERRPTPCIPNRIASIYLIGVCGTGMGSLAGMLREKGYQVSGSDQHAYPPMSEFLTSKGIAILDGWHGDNLLSAAPPDLVVVGNVCRKDNPEVLAAQQLGIPCVSFPETLRLLFLQHAKQRVVITGTHGKTSTCSLLAWLLEAAGLDPSFMIGGIAGNFGSNYKLGKNDVFIVEGDEYDSAYFDKVPKFWHYEPTLLGINNIEFDHADIYPSLGDIVEVFEKLCESMPSDGTIWANLDDARVRRVVTRAPCERHGVGLHGSAELKAEAVEYLPGGGARMQVTRASQMLGELRSPLPGEHNVRNVLMATGLALSLGVPFAVIADALPRFLGVRKRQELIGVAHDVTIYDDFAHHPTAVRETVAAIRHRHPQARLWGLFEAKSNTSRRAIFQSDYPDALRLCDRVVLSSPWKKDDLPTSELIDLDQVVTDLEERGVQARLIADIDELVAFVAAQAAPGDVVLGMSGSAFGGLHRKLLAALQARVAHEGV